MRSTLFEDEFSEVDVGAGFQLQNERMLKVQLHRNVLAVRDSAIAWQGSATFRYKGAGVGRYLKRAATGEGADLMEVSGRPGADVFFGFGDRYVHILCLEDEQLTFNGANLLAFDARLDWDIERVRGLGGMVASGLTNMTLRGSGPVALTTRSKPVLLDAGERVTAVDPTSLVAWSSGLTPKLSRHGGFLRAMIGRGSGELFASTFRGRGWVLVENGPHTAR